VDDILININLKKLYLLFIAFFIVGLGSLLTYYVHGPSIGIDDANITQTYAKNIAEGLGYVYNSGGEHVEGSTSWAWTVINVFFFFISEEPEAFIAVFCFLLTVLTVNESLRLLRSLTSLLEINFPVCAVLLTALLISYASFFTWTIWALMDVTLWTLLFTVIVGRFSSIIIDENFSTSTSATHWFLYTALAFLPLVRPEGIAVSIGFTLLFSLVANSNRHVYFRNALWISGGVSLALFFTLTAWRLHYFGFPAPNTFYAKVSVNYFTQTLEGIKYLVRYALHPIVLVQAVFAFGFIGYFSTLRRSTDVNAALIAAVWISSLFGVFGIYVFLGGDHFGSARQFQVVTPILATLASIGGGVLVSRTIKEANRDKHVLVRALNIFLIIAIGMFVTIPSIGKYMHDGGKIDHEFRIAENGRELGALLNQLPSRPSVGVITAGGFAYTYDGHVYDLMGLNWTIMAHANPMHNINAPKNHAAFSKDVFYKHLPDIVTPRLGTCVFRSDEKLSATFSNLALNGILVEERFKQKYVQACFGDAIFFIKKELSNNLQTILRVPS